MIVITYYHDVCMLQSNSCKSVDYSPPGSSVHRVLQARIWSGLPCPPPGDLPNPEIEPASLTSLALASGFFATSATWEALPTMICIL